MSWSRILVLAAFVSAGCETTAPNDDDSGGGGDGAELCSGPSCENSPDCPAEEPTDGASCPFYGNCHYCDADGGGLARGYTCGAGAFTAQGEFECDL